MVEASQYFYIGMKIIKAGKLKNAFWQALKLIILIYKEIWHADFKCANQKNIEVLLDPLSSFCFIQNEALLLETFEGFKKLTNRNNTHFHDAFMP